MRRNFVLPHHHDRRLHTPCASDVDRQVEFLRTFSDFEVDTWGRCHRVYAVTRRNVLITTGLAVVTASQLAVGICLVTIAARKKSEVELWTRKN